MFPKTPLDGISQMGGYAAALMMIQFIIFDREPRGPLQLSDLWVGLGTVAFVIAFGCATQAVVTFIARRCRPDWFTDEDEPPSPQ